MFLSGSEKRKNTVLVKKKITSSVICLPAFVLCPSSVASCGGELQQLAIPPTCGSFWIAVHSVAALLILLLCPL